MLCLPYGLKCVCVRVCNARGGLVTVACMTMSPGVLLSCGNSLLLRVYTLLGLPHGAAASYRLGSACTRLGALVSTAGAPRTNTLTHAHLYTQTLPCPCHLGTRWPRPFLRLHGHTHTRTHTAPDCPPPRPLDEKTPYVPSPHHARPRLSVRSGAGHATLLLCSRSQLAPRCSAHYKPICVSTSKVSTGFRLSLCEHRVCHTTAS
jgi:hypothetical protein